jgi:hypothetical protein
MSCTGPSDCVCTDSHGDLYLGEVTKSCRSWHPPSRGVLPPGTHAFQRLRRVR